MWCATVNDLTSVGLVARYRREAGPLARRVMWPLLPDAGRATVPSRFRCPSGDGGDRVRRRCTGRYLLAHLRRILLMAPQVWSRRARQSPLRPRVAVIH